MDPPAKLLVEVDSSLALAREAARRGFTICWYEAQSLALTAGRLTAAVHPMDFGPAGAWLNPDAPAGRSHLGDMDVVLIRQDPPFDMAYITATYLLEHIQADVLVLNDPAGLRNAPEKLLPVYFPHLMPPTLVTSDAQAVHAFRAAQGPVIVKPLFRAGGAGVVYLSETDPNLDVVLELLSADGLPVMIQAFIPEVAEGDKRIVMVDGRVVGCLLRTPATGSIRANMHVGGTISTTVMTDRDTEICEAIGPVLSEMGLMLAGVDVIGPWLTEINVTSPGMLPELRELTGIDAAWAFWDAVALKFDL